MSSIYRERTCAKCLGPWSGIGMVCNMCRMIEAQEKSAPGYTTQGYGTPVCTDKEIAEAIVFWIVFAWVCSWGDWTIGTWVWDAVCFCFHTAWYLFKIVLWLVIGWWEFPDLGFPVY